ncbi:hypothetical protein M6D93_01615 [Jatrophihabitans telluris]|uniref:Uncharacterized protein n=1 Tax=Jatrophihabitans telluris TaxID=2038343 RepID=A0ABY4QYK5_9ACTN|nr:hypothetical protein [Jatrophihabitans telluris]UQX88713.1 hypothetical protein M6D93_01615 [Jatrophihabitans telluris]
MTAHHPDATTVRLAVGDQDMRRFLYVESVRDADGGQIKISRELEDELNDFAADLDPVHCDVTDVRRRRERGRLRRSRSRSRPARSPT